MARADQQPLLSNADPVDTSEVVGNDRGDDVEQDAPVSSTLSIVLLSIFTPMIILITASCFAAWCVAALFLGALVLRTNHDDYANSPLRNFVVVGVIGGAVTFGIFLMAGTIFGGLFYLLINGGKTFERWYDRISRASTREQIVLGTTVFTVLSLVSFAIGPMAGALGAAIGEASGGLEDFRLVSVEAGARAGAVGGAILLGPQMVLLLFIVAFDFVDRWLRRRRIMSEYNISI